MNVYNDGVKDNVGGIEGKKKNPYLLKTLKIKGKKIRRYICIKPRQEKRSL